MYSNQMIPVAKPTKSIPRVKLRVNLDILLNKDFIEGIELTKVDKVVFATVHISGNDMIVTGSGLNIKQAILDLDKMVISANFEL